MSTRQLSLKELRALAQKRLGNRAAELKTRQELTDAIAATEPKAAPKLMVPLAGPLPEPVPPVVVKELPPEPMIWVGEAPLPQITARPLEALPPKPAIAVLGNSLQIGPTPVILSGVEGRAPKEQHPDREPTPFILSGVEGRGRAALSRGDPTPSSLDSARDERAVLPEEMASEAGSPARDDRGGLQRNDQRSWKPARDERGPPGTDHFFVQPEQPQLPVTYEDDRILTFSRDPRTLYVVWDFMVSRFDPGPAQGQVVNESGVTVQSFAVAGPSGSAFVEQLPPGIALKVEVRQHSELLGASGWVQLPAAERPIAIPGPAPTGIEAPAAVLNAPSSVV